MISYYDKDLVNKIIKPFGIENHSTWKEFWGYKIGDNKYYSFFFDVYKNEALLFTFRFNPQTASNEKIFVTYDNVETIRKIINAILHNRIVEEKEYNEYIYHETNLTSEQKRLIKTNKALKSHWKLPGLLVVPDPDGINIDRLDISYRLKNALYRYDIITIKQLYDLAPDAMKQMRLLGSRSYREAMDLKRNLSFNFNEEVKRDTRVFFIPTEDNDDTIVKNPKVRKKRENEGKKWELIEEQQLIEEHIMGLSIPEIARIHKRSLNGIRKRLIKLNMINAEEVPRFH